MRDLVLSTFFFVLAFTQVTEGIDCNAADESNLFKCDSGECTLRVFKCNGRVDCEDGSDEKEYCTPGRHFDCKIFENDDKKFKCDHGGCILRDFLCDGRDDCGDGSDELEGTVCNLREPESDSQEGGIHPGFIGVILFFVGVVLICICIVCGWTICLSIKHYILHKARIQAVRRHRSMSHPAQTTLDQSHVPTHMPLEDKQFMSIALPTNPELYDVEAPPAYTTTQFATSDPSSPPGHDTSGQQCSVDFQLQGIGNLGNCNGESCGGGGGGGGGGGSCGGESGSCGGGNCEGESCGGGGCDDVDDGGESCGSGGCDDVGDGGGSCGGGSCGGGDD